MAPCPECSPNEPVSVTRFNNRRVRCAECGTYFDLPPEKKPVEVSLIVSRHGRTTKEKVALRPGETLSMDEERVFDIGGEVAGARITALELKGGRRREQATAGELACIWAMAIDEVTVRVTVQSGWRSKSSLLKVHGIYEFSVGGEEDLGGVNFRVKALRTRDGVTFRRKGDAVLAKDLRTIYAEEPRARRRRPSGKFKNTRRPAAELWRKR